MMGERSVLAYATEREQIHQTSPKVFGAVLWNTGSCFGLGLISLKNKRTRSPSHIVSRI